jgi:hypothetical protein
MKPGMPIDQRRQDFTILLGISIICSTLPLIAQSPGADAGQVIVDIKHSAGPVNGSLELMDLVE